MERKIPLSNKNMHLVVETLKENKMRVDGGLVNWLTDVFCCMKYLFYSSFI